MIPRAFGYQTSSNLTAYVKPLPPPSFNVRSSFKALQALAFMLCAIQSHHYFKPFNLSYPLIRIIADHKTLVGGTDSANAGKNVGMLGSTR